MAQPAIEIKSVHDEVERLSRRLERISGAYEKAIWRTKKRARGMLRTRTDRGIRALYNLPQKKVLERITVRDRSRLGFELESKPKDRTGWKRLSLMHYKASPKTVAKPSSYTKRFPSKIRRKRVSVNVLKSTGKRPLPGAFIAPMRGKKGAVSGVGVFVRKTSDPRSEIRKLEGPSVGNIMMQRSLKATVGPPVRKQVRERMLHEMRWVLKKAGVSP